MRMWQSIHLLYIRVVHLVYLVTPQEPLLIFRMAIDRPDAVGGAVLLEDLLALLLPQLLLPREQESECTSQDGQWQSNSQTGAKRHCPLDHAIRLRVRRLLIPRRRSCRCRRRDSRGARLALSPVRTRGSSIGLNLRARNGLQAAVRPREGLLVVAHLGAVGAAPVLVLVEGRGAFPDVGELVRVDVGAVLRALVAVELGIRAGASVDLRVEDCVLAQLISLSLWDSFFGGICCVLTIACAAPKQKPLDIQVSPTAQQWTNPVAVLLHGTVLESVCVPDG